MLTDTAVRKTKPKDKPFKLADSHGLYLLIRPDGARCWRMDYRHAGKRGPWLWGAIPKFPSRRPGMVKRRRESCWPKGSSIKL